MRRSLLLSCALLASLAAADRHVGAGYGYSTIQAAIDASAPGDTVVVHAGTYRESVRVAKNDLTIRNAGFDRVVVTGLDVVTGWSDDTGAVDRAALALSDATLDDTQVFVDGVWQAPATYPNRPRNMLNWSAWGAKVTASNTGTVRFYEGMAPGSTGLPAGDWTGAIVHFNTGNGWVSHQGIVRSHDATTTSTPVEDRSYTWARFWKWGGFYNNGGGKGYLIQHRRALDTAGEWYWDKTAQQLYLWTPTGAPAGAATVEAQTRRWGVSFDACTGSTVRGLHVRAAAVRAINGASACNFTDGSVRFGVGFFRTIGQVENGTPPEDPNTPIAARYSIDMAGAGHAVVRSLISHGWGGGILLGADGRIEDCLLEDLNWSGIYAPGTGSSLASISGPERQLVSQSTVRYVGRDAIRPAADSRYELNDLHDAMGLSRDGGAIYAVVFDLLGTRITRNWLHDVEGAVTNMAVGSYGIYCDNDSDGWIIDRNALWNLPTGIFLHADAEKGWSNDRCDIANNTFLNVPRQYEATIVADVRVWNNAVDSDTHLPMPGTLVQATAVASAADYRNAAVGDFRPQATATMLIDQGVANPYTGGSTGAPDIGAYEYNGGATLGRWRPGVRALMPDFADDLFIRVEAETALDAGFSRISNDLGSARALAQLDAAEGALIFRPTMPAGIYDLHLVHHDEDDGSATLTLNVGGTDRGSWKADWSPGGATPSNGNRLTGTWRGIALTAGEAITVRATRNGSEALCVDYLELIPRRLDSERFDTTNLIHNQHGEDTPNDPSWFGQARGSFWTSINPSQSGALIEFGIVDTTGGLGSDALVRVTPLASKPPVASEWWTLSMAQGKAADPSKTYSISFRARAEAARKMTVQWRSKIRGSTYLLRHIDLTTTAQTYTIADLIPTTSDGAIDRTAELLFCFGQHPARVWLDDFDMREVGANAGADAAPAAPASLSATPGTAGRIVLDWPNHPAGDVVQYRVYRAGTADVRIGDQQLVAVASASAWIDTDVVGGRRYYYRVVAVDRGGLVSTGSPVDDAVATDERTVRIQAVDTAAMPTLDGAPDHPTTVDGQGATVFDALDPAVDHTWRFVEPDGDG